MSVWKNITENPLTVELNGPGQKPTVVAPGKNLVIQDELDFVVGTLIGTHQVELVDPDAKPEPVKPVPTK